VIPRKTRNGIALLAVLTATSFWIGRGSPEKAALPVAGLDTKLDYALRQFEARHFDADGRQAVRMQAPMLANDAATGIARIERPSFQVIHEGSRWDISAQTATVTADRERIILAGDVSMRRRDRAAAQALEVNTSAMILEVTPRIARSDQAVVIVDSNSTLEAIGFRIDMRDNTYRLDEQVKGRYVIN
jgi:LPS export ABC transporter protein LptC